MKMSSLFSPTLKEIPAEAEIASHRLMLRAGMIRKLASGIYSYLPLGYRVIRKVENIVREVFDSYGAQELLMPALHPIEIWEETGRSEEMGPNMFRLYDRSNRQFCLGMTHEEIITDLVRRELKSYKNLPVAFYQIQTKFRDEPRPRSGLIRAREFIMKDLYSFHRNWECLGEYYDKMYRAYLEVFSRCGLEVKVVLGDPGAMGGDYCHEFMCLSGIGEDALLLCENCGYSASKSVARYFVEKAEPKEEKELTLGEVDTPDIKSIEDLVSFLKIDAKKFLKSMIYKADGRFVVALVRGDRVINESFLRKELKVKALELAGSAEIEKLTGAPMGFSGPVGLKNVETIADEEVRYMKNFIAGANKVDKHFINVNFGKDFVVKNFGLIREAEESDCCLECKKGDFKTARGIELGHIFKLGTKYSDSMKAYYADEDGKEKPFIMGCYGIGVTRIVSALIEKNYDKDGIVWPLSVAPYHIVVIPVVDASEHMEAACNIYSELASLGFEVVLDDRNDLRAGVKFKDADLIGFPIRIVVGKAIKEDKIEIKLRDQKDSFLVKKEELVDNIEKLIPHSLRRG